MEILADILRPKKLDDIIGQQHLVGKDKIIRNLVDNDHLVSMILYGKPGIGKTSIAQAICNQGVTGQTTKSVALIFPSFTQTNNLNYENYLYSWSEFKSQVIPAISKPF